MQEDGEITKVREKSLTEVYNSSLLLIKNYAIKNSFNQRTRVEEHVFFSYENYNTTILSFHTY